MTTYLDVVRDRTDVQRLTHSEFRKPAEVVRWLGAVQAQDYSGAKWALGLRCPGLTDADVDRAFDDGTILRTHVLRPTWHFLTPADIHWILTLTAPQVHRFNAPYYRQLELDAAVFARSRRVFERALGSGDELTRSELQAALAKAGIAASGMRLAYVVMHAELERVIASGARRGRQFTYALLDARAPHAEALKPDEALARLTRRFFQSHGPATVKDFSWWSGLTAADSRRGLEIAGRTLEQTRVGDRTYWSGSTSVARRSSNSAGFLLPNYDECLIAYKDRGPNVAGKGSPTRARDPFPHHVLIGGRLIGSWGRTITARSARVQIAAYGSLTKQDRRAIERAAERYGRFLSLPVALAITR